MLRLAGTPATDESLNLDRDWRKRPYTYGHDPVRWKYHGSVTIT